MFSRVRTGTLWGAEAELVEVETDLGRGLPVMNMVGLPDATVREAKERIRTAMMNSGYSFPAKRITINLAPAGSRKEGSHFDLPIAIGILSALGYISAEHLNDYGIIGELSLEGGVTGIKGVLPLAMGFRKRGIKNIILPFENAEEGALLEDVNIYPVKTLNEAEFLLSGKAKNAPYIKRKINIKKAEAKDDYKDVIGQESIKRALVICGAGSHGIFMKGPPGTGKTMLARRLPSILPPLEYEEILEVTKIYSVGGELGPERQIVTERPFRAPHHSISPMALVGGGIRPRPGEVSLAHCGVLFLDELGEFPRRLLDMMRQPLEDGKINIVRNNMEAVFPSRFMLVGAGNPCKCGYYGDPTHECSCSPAQVASYRGNLSGPLMDRIDIHVELAAVKGAAFYGGGVDSYSKSSKEMSEEVKRARDIQKIRYENEEILYNSQLTPYLANKYCQLDKECENLLKMAFDKLGISARGHGRIVRVARTISDLEGSKNIRAEHIAEAIGYREKR